MARSATTWPNSRATTQEQERISSRILAIDALRGLALVLMALDHANFFVGVGLQAESYFGNAVTLQGPAYWVSGLLTNLASPIFWLLSGTSLALYSQAHMRRGTTEGAIGRFFLVRAVIILILDLTICAFFWMESAPYVHVLTTIALAMMLLSGLRMLPGSLLLTFSLALLLGYQGWLALLPQPVQEPTDLLSSILLLGSYQTNPAIGFPLLGWAPLMWLGYWLGRYGDMATWQHPRHWLLSGGGLLGTWALLHGTGVFGDFGAGFDSASLVIMSKTPPALTYLLFNLGLAALVMAGFYYARTWFAGRWMEPLVVIGQVSLFFYVAHIVCYHLIASGMHMLLPSLPGPRIIWGYATWAVGMIILLGLSVAYRRLRKRYSRSVLRYL
ncbi:MAG: heparan-alpha-glucosaminide N-acetyltransferase domain-containing protein [Chloroflexaceae bacterium]|jgi:uncharacterized membrane protein|nr:heparan-alpha-glucosaminide N-acetyltransferase domain-containing protein [Chloroflexaceae bacterium]